MSNVRYPVVKRRDGGWAVQRQGPPGSHRSVVMTTDDPDLARLMSTLLEQVQSGAVELEVDWTTGSIMTRRVPANAELQTA